MQYNTLKRVTFDFDGVLHRSVIPGTIHPICFESVDLWEPRLDVHELLRKEAELHDVYIVTARGSQNLPELREFVAKFNLPVKGIICCDGVHKSVVLLQMNSVRHYDDDPTLGKFLKGSTVEFILSKPPYFASDRYEDYKWWD